MAGRSLELLVEATEIVAVAAESPQDIGRREFFRRAGISVIATAGSGLLAPGCATHVIPPTDEFVRDVMEYLRYKDVEKHPQKSAELYWRIANYIAKNYKGPIRDINENATRDINFLPYLNKYLPDKGYFLMLIFHPVREGTLVAKLYKIFREDIFDGFIKEDGKKQSSFFGIRFGSYRRFLLGEEIFSTHDVPPFGVNYTLNPSGASGFTPESNIVLGIPHDFVKKRFGINGQAVVDKLVEGMTMHEIGHNEPTKTGSEYLPFVIEFGYEMAEGITIRSVADIVEYLNSKQPKFSPETPFRLEKIYRHYGDKNHIFALRRIGKELGELCIEINKLNPKYTANPLKISDQQMHASMALLFYRATSGAKR